METERNAATVLANPIEGYCNGTHNGWITDDSLVLLPGSSSRIRNEAKGETAEASVA